MLAHLVGTAASMLAIAQQPVFTTNITVFHVYPGNFGPAPVNMNTADLHGDMFFDLRGVATPLECAHPTNESAHDCDNPEVIAPNLVISQVQLEVAGNWSQYGRCNLCVNGTDNHGNNSCTNGAYWCDCGDFGGPPEQCAAQVGRQNLSAWLGRMGGCWSRNGEPAPEWDCWRDAVAKKTCEPPFSNGGFWYSTTSDGYCGDGRYASRDGCTWRLVQQIKRVNKTCSDNSIFSTVEVYGKDCFANCSGVGPQRNTSSTCWIECFYASVVGPDAGKQGGAVAGMPLSDLEQAWNAPFASEDPTKGGCPNI
eukprot:m.50883 g.50883  ORF g.50883 m.50883 type:complete len:309 (+) comp7270_c1_seq1:80-1006(+)